MTGLDGPNKFVLLCLLWPKIFSVVPGTFYNLKGEWDVENIGVAPDIEVEYTPEVNKGRDPQLERAVQEALRLLEQNPIRRDREEMKCKLPR